jgi:AbrB family looped-hinge helix DNA binding protein
MKHRGTIDVIIRPKRQITLPREICEELEIGPGDRLELELNGSILMAKAKKAIALEALHEIREAFQRSGIKEEELQEASRQQRQKFAGEHHATNA